MSLYLTDENGKLIQIAGIIPIHNDLKSDRADIALSAAQGKILRDLITNISINGGYDDSGVKELIFNIRSDLNNYYYTKTETDSLLSAIPKFQIKIVEALPTSGISYSTLYLVVSGTKDKSIYTEYIYVDNQWEKLGEQTTNISNAITSEELTTILNNYFTKEETTNKILELLQGYVTVETMEAQKYLTKIPEEYITESKLNAQGFIKTIPDDYVTQSEMEAQGYLKSLPDNVLTEDSLKDFATTESLNSVNNTAQNNTTQITNFKTLSLKDSGLLDAIFPIGSIQMFIDETDPNIKYGGTWERLQDKFLLGAGNLYSVNTEGGNKDSVVISHTHTAVENGAHTHTAQSAGSHTHGPGTLSGYYKMRDSDKGDGIWGAEAYYYSAHDTNSAAGAVVINSGTTASGGAHTHTTDSKGAHTHTINPTGSDGLNANMPPYLAVYMWKRIA